MSAFRMLNSFSSNLPKTSRISNRLPSKNLFRASSAPIRSFQSTTRCMQNVGTVKAGEPMKVVMPSSQSFTIPEKEKTPFEQAATKELKKIFNDIKVKDMLDKKGTTEIVYIDENAMTVEAVKKMSEKDKGAVVVTSNGVPKGIFTERDYMNKLILQGKSSKKTPIKDVTEYNALHTVKESTSLGECGELMIRKVIRHLPVVGESGKMIGMISVRDVAEHMVRAGHKANDVRLSQSPDTVEDVFNRLGRVSSEECFVDSSDSVLKALELMNKHRIGAVFVVEGQKLVGIFTERDYLHKVILQEKMSKTTTVGEVMTPDVVVVSPSEQIGKCLTLMVQGKFRNLPVVPLVGDHELDSGEYRSVLGIITLLDVIRFLWNVSK